MYLLIENVTECPIEGLTILGLSTARDEQTSIGQFGSGNKHAINVCLRHGLTPIFYSGHDCIEFYAKPAMMRDKAYQQVYAKVEGKHLKAGWCLEFGELDWTNVDMGLREFVSNALDQADGNPSDIKVDIVDSMSGRQGYTRVYLPLTPDVQKFYGEISGRFLHFRYVGEADYSKSCVIVKGEPSKARIYRKGVFVREMGSRTESLFDYNFGEEVKIDESRNMSEHSCECAAAEAAGQDRDALCKIFQALIKWDDCWEAHFSEYYLKRKADKKTWQYAWMVAAGDAAISLDTSAYNEHAKRKGIKCYAIKASAWFQAMCDSGIPNILEKLSHVESKGHEIIEATPTVKETANIVWRMICKNRMNEGKRKPRVKLFSKIMDGGTRLRGYYDSNEQTVYINIDDQDNFQIMLEEMSHYVTGSTDNSRDFQDFAFKGWIRRELRNSKKWGHLVP